MPPLAKSRPVADVTVIGGGLIGCSIAFRLAQARVSVLVIDRGEPGREASSAAAGMLAPQGEMVEASPFFDLCASSRNLYASFVAEIEEMSGERIAYHREGTLLVAIDEQECRELDRVFRAQSGLGLPIERLAPEAISNSVPNLSTEIRSGLLIPGDHWLDSEKLAQALVTACRRLGVEFRTGSPVGKLTVRNSRVESLELESSNRGGGSVIAGDHFVLAAGCWSGELAAAVGLSIPMSPCRGQMIEFECPTDLPRVVRAGHHYLVPRPPGRVLAGTTGEYVGYDKAVTGEGLRSILEGVTRIAPAVKGFRFCRAWAGLRPDTADHLPILGHAALENLVFATGHFRNGILLAPLTAQLISELILTGSTSRSLEAYCPLRFRSAAPPRRG